MFTGIIEQMGLVASVDRNKRGLQLKIHCNGWDTPVKQGESISIAGCCLTVVYIDKSEGAIELVFDVIPETIKMTTFSNISQGKEVNIERALRLDDLVGGHFIQGHIDGVAEIIESEQRNPDEVRLRIDTQSLNQNTLTPKGSITMDGVSLTIASIGDNWLEVAIIPLTVKLTTLGLLAKGDYVNIETDLLARTVDQILNKSKQQA